MSFLGVWLIVFWICTVLQRTLELSISVPDNVELTSGMNHFVLYTSKRNWNSAKLVCESVGGKLAQIDDPGIFQLIKTAFEENSLSIDLLHEAYTGAHWTSDERVLFVDDQCSELDMDTMVMPLFNDANQKNYDANKRCMRIVSPALVLDAHDCSHNHEFLCQTVTYTTPCTYTGVNTKPMVFGYPDATALLCQGLCQNTPGCYLVGNYTSSYCVLLVVTPGQTDMYQRTCVSVATDSSDTSSISDTSSDQKVPVTCVPQTGTGPPEINNTVGVPLAADAPCSPSISYVYLSTTVPECSSNVITIAPPVQTVVETLTEVVQSIVYHTITETDVQTPITDASCLQSVLTVTATQVLPPLMSTVIVTSEKPCSTAETFATLTQVCPEPSAVVSYIQTTQSCICSSPTNVISSDIHLVPSEQSAFEVCYTYFTDMQTDDLSALVSSIFSNLALDRNNLSKQIRQKISVPDERVSAKGIGSGFAVLVALPFLLVFVTDCPKIVQHLRSCLQRIQTSRDP